MKTDNYLVTSSTIMLKYINETKTRVYELNREFIVYENMSDIIFNSCEFYGSTYNGRLDFSKSVLNLNIKLPIIIEENKKIIFFPTRAIYNEECIWISNNNLNKIEKENENCVIYFKNGKKYRINISCDIINRQIFNCLKIEKLLKTRHENV